MDGIRLVVLAEPEAGAGSAGSRAATRAGSLPVEGPGGTRAPAWREIPGGSVATVAVIADVLDRMVASRLGRARPRLSWGIGAGGDVASATANAELALRAGRLDGTGLGFATGDPWRDALLADLGRALAALLDDLTPRQAQIAEPILVDGARQAEVAETLGVSRATVSVAVARGRLPAISGARRAIGALLAGPPPPDRVRVRAELGPAASP